MADVVRGDAEAIDAYRSQIRPVPGQVGLVAYVGRSFVCLEAFGRPGTYLPLHDMIVGSCAAEAVECGNEPSTRRGSAHGLRARLRDGPWTPFPSPGLGSDLRLTANGWRATALVAAEGPVQLAAFPVR